MSYSSEYLLDAVQRERNPKIADLIREDHMSTERIDREKRSQKETPHEYVQRQIRSRRWL